MIKELVILFAMLLASSRGYPVEDLPVEAPRQVVANLEVVDAADYLVNTDNSLTTDASTTQEEDDLLAPAETAWHGGGWGHGGWGHGHGGWGWRGHHHHHHGGWGWGGHHHHHHGWFHG